jgi:hypothetical protein
VRTQSVVLPVALTLLLGGLITTRASAQFDQYTAPGAPPAEPADRKGQVEKAMEEARWRLGRLRVDPTFGLRDVQFVDNSSGSAEGEQSDFTASASAGLRAYVRTGPKIFWAAHAIPEYVWWRDAVGRRRLNGRYGAGMFAFWNRLTVEGTAAREENQSFQSPEISQLAHSRSDRLAVTAELKVSGRVFTFVGAEQVEVRSLDEQEPTDAPFERFDRDVTLLRGGVGYRLPRGFTIGVGFEDSEVDFFEPRPGFDRSNRGTSPLIQIRQANADRFIRLEVVQRDLEPKPGSTFIALEDTTTRLDLGLNTAGRISTFVYGSQGLVYSLQQGYSYLQDDRLGAAVRWKVGRRSSARAFAEVGRNDYTVAVVGTPERQDDTLAVGATLDFLLGRNLSWGLRVLRNELDSNLPGQDRTVTSIGAGVTFGLQESTWF